MEMFSKKIVVLRRKYTMKESNVSCNLRDCLLCKSCLPHWIPAVSAYKKNYLIRKGQQVFTEGAPVTGIYFVYSGVLKVHKKWGKEKELIIRFAKQGDIAGHLGLGRKTQYPVSATALEDTMVCYLNMDFFESTLRVNTDLTYTLMRFLADELQGSHRGMRDLAHMSVRARVAQALLSLKDQFGTRPDGSIGLTISRQDIASFAGTTYETLFKVLNELVGDGYLFLDGKRITLRNEPELQKIVQMDSI